ncbi:hypothetical protein KCV06_g615, partial [Aureobasidium melanogenum]
MTCPSHVKEQLTRGEEVEEESQTEREGGCHQSPVAIQGDSHSRRIGFVLDVSQSLIFRMRTRLYQFLCTSLSYDHRWQEAAYVAEIKHEENLLTKKRTAEIKSLIPAAVYTSPDAATRIYRAPDIVQCRSLFRS